MPQISINPTTGIETARFDFATPAEVDAALDAAVSAQASWREVPVEKRAGLLRQIAAELRAGKSRYAGLITAEMGKPIVEAEGEVEKCAWTLDYYSDAAPGFLAAENYPSSATESGVVFDPLGVILGIMPWNFPFWQYFRFAAPALAAGNGIILKHAGNVPQCALAIGEIMQKAGVPAGLAGTLLIEAKAVAPLIADARIAAVSLTGSTSVGSIVAAEAAKALKKQVLELGGSDPFIVLADADITEAAAVAVKARYTNGGQSCVNAKRFIVEAQVADQFVAAFVANVAKLKVGDPTKRDTDIGPMARRDLRDDLHRQVERSVAAGATLRIGGEPLAGPGYYYAPTVLDNVTPEMAAFSEETFGPVAAVIRVASVDEAIRLANQTEFGLGAALWTRDIARARGLARRIEAGAVFINGLVASDARLPFGGIKKSGYGRELGVYGIREFVNIKTIWIGPAVAAATRQDNKPSTAAAVAKLQAAILSPEKIPARERGGGARTVPLVTRSVGATGFINGITIFEPNAAIALHKHNCDESVVLLEGNAIAEIDGVQHELKALDTTFIPANLPHRFINRSASEPMKILWIYGSVDATRTNIATGETRAVDDEHKAAIVGTGTGKRA
ncbi:MAG: aldehyde dehydrogenase family protein [Bauldia sp.]